MAAGHQRDRNALLTLNTALSADEFASILEHSGAAALVTHVDYLDRFATVPAGAG